MSATVSTKKTSTKTKAVKVELEKAEEKNEKPVRNPVPMVPNEVVASIKNQAQIEEELLQQQIIEEVEESRQKSQNRILFYGGVIAGVGILYLIHRYSKSAPPEVFTEELVNEVVSVVAPN